MAGYWNQPDATRAALDEHGWLRSGDAARIDDDGYAWIVDRVADAIQVHGKIVYPGDVERALTQHPAIADAGVAAHAGSTAAFVVLADDCHVTEGELLDHCRGRLEDHEVPTAVLFVDRLPRSSVGKLLRSELSFVRTEPARGAAQ
jgi:fatty-acyl-CoA synthase